MDERVDESYRVSQEGGGGVDLDNGLMVLDVCGMG